MKKYFGIILILGVTGTVFLKIANHEEPISAEEYLQIGIEMGASGKHDDAITAFKKSLNVSPNFILAYLNLGNAYGNTGRYEESIASYKEGIQLNPRHSEVPQMEMNIAWIAHKMNDNETAIIYAKKAIQSFTDWNDYAGVAMAGTRLRIIEEKSGKSGK